MAATEMNESTPMPDKGHFGLQMEGLATAVLYLVCFGYSHLAATGAGSTQAFMDTKVLAIMLGGLIAIPVVTALPMVGLRRILATVLPPDSAVGATLPFAQFALYGLQCLLVWVVTREAYAWIFAPAPVVAG